MSSRQTTSHMIGRQAKEESPADIFPEATNKAEGPLCMENRVDEQTSLFLEYGSGYVLHNQANSEHRFPLHR
jgi:hypothetical protein